MEPLDDKELNEMLRRWEAPAAPASLARRVLAGRKPWWRWLATGTIRVPVPVGIAVALLLGFWFYFHTSVQPQTPVSTPGSVSLADFQPVQRLDPVVIGEQR